MKKAIWISYDFGLKGDYMGLYTWLDDNNAVECGNGLAFCNYNIRESSKTTEEIIDIIEKDLKSHVKLSKSDRLYMVWKDGAANKIKGRFISGSRKQSPWEGYGRLRDSSIIDTEE